MEIGSFLFLLVYFAGTGSLSFIIAKGYVFNELKFNVIRLIHKRRIEQYAAEFLYCPMCIGFWVGVVLDLIFGKCTGLFGVILGLVISGSITAVSALIVDRILTKTEDE